MNKSKIEGIYKEVARQAKKKTYIKIESRTIRTLASESETHVENNTHRNANTTQYNMPANTASRGKTKEKDKMGAKKTRTQS